MGPDSDVDSPRGPTITRKIVHEQIKTLKHQDQLRRPSLSDRRPLTPLAPNDFF